MRQPRYAIGIDLGTSNCALAYVDLGAGGAAQALALPLPQLQSLDTLVRGALLPSCFYYLTDAEAAQGQLDPISEQSMDPPSGYAVGVLARERLASQPGRVIHSAKSWLAHAGVDREALILPFASEEIPAERRLSPVEVSAAYLVHLKEAWDHAFARDDAGNAFVAQRVVITVPASFDEAAQALTRKAAELAGYPADCRLLEEPQAAFYAWLDGEDGGSAERLLGSLPNIANRPQNVLVCDVGGGTTDFSLFRVTRPATGQARPTIERIAVSEHLLLGGDNIDLALAHLLERRFRPDSEERVSRRQWAQLVPQARALKERVLATGGDAEELCHVAVAVAGEGAGLFAAALTASVPRSAVEELVLEGFFPLTPVGEGPHGRGGGLREIGLPYATDSAISRHLAAFLQGRVVDAVLFAGGTLQPPAIQLRLVDLLERWQEQRPEHLVLHDMNLAIAQGAARFAALPPGSPERIGGGYRHSVYIEVQRSAPDAPPRLVCVLPQGFAEGGQCRLAAPVFELLVNRPVRFTAYVSNRRPQDVPGSVVALDEGGFRPLPSLQTTIVLDDADAFNPRKAVERRIEVELEATLSDVGVLQLTLVSAAPAGRWALEFNLRKPLSEPAPSAAPAASTDAAPAAAEALGAVQARIELFFGKKQSLDPAHKVKSLGRDLEQIVGSERGKWSIALLRALWSPLHEGITRRSRSLDHENVWLYLAGFSLRPGYGTDLDPWRVKQLWECFELGLVHKKEKSAQSNWWMMWRRVAGGLSAQQQEQLFAAALPQLRQAPAEFVEGTRLLGSLERVAPERKQALAEMLFERVLGGRAVRQAHVFWALARLLGRVPLYAGADSVTPAGLVEDCFSRAEALDWKALGLQPLNVVFAAAARLTGVRALDIHDPIRARVIDKLRRSGATAAQIRVVQEYCEVSTEDRNELFGEQLPAGLLLAGG